jgi:hypothetical protein
MLQIRGSSGVGWRDPRNREIRNPIDSSQRAIQCRHQLIGTKRFGQRTQGETTNTKTRATARIALTC